MRSGPAAATTRQWKTACAAGCLIFLGSLAAVAWQLQLLDRARLGQLGAPQHPWLGLPDVLEWIDDLGNRAVLLPAALILPLLLPIRRHRHWWLPAVVLLGSWTLGSLAAAVLGSAPARRVTKSRFPTSMP